MTELLPCPFCGSEAELFAIQHVFVAECKNAGCLGHTGISFDTEEEAIEAWNKRAERTCEMIEHKHMDKTVLFECSSCHGAVYQDADYCPCCGAKVVSKV